MFCLIHVIVLLLVIASCVESNTRSFYSSVSNRVVPKREFGATGRVINNRGYQRQKNTLKTKAISSNDEEHNNENEHDEQHDEEHYLTKDRTLDGNDSDKDEFCREIEDILSKDAYISFVPKRLASYPYIFDCIKFESSGDLHGLILSLLLWRPDIDYDSMMRFCQKAVMYGRLSFLRIIFEVYHIHQQEAQGLMRQALEWQYWEIAADLRQRIGAEFDYLEWFCPLIRDRVENALRMMEIGLVTHAEALDCLHRRDTNDEVIIASNDHHREDIMLMLREMVVLDATYDNANTNNTDSKNINVIVFDAYLKYSQQADPMLFACKSGDVMLFKMLENYHLPRAATISGIIANPNLDLKKLSVKQQIDEKTKIASTIQRNGVLLQPDLKYLLAAIHAGHIDLCRRLLDLFIYTPLQLMDAHDYADQLQNPAALRLLKEYGAYQMTEFQFDFRKGCTWWSAETLQTDIRKHYHQLDLSRVYLDASRHFNAGEAKRIIQMLVDNHIPLSSGGAWEALEFLATGVPDKRQSVELIKLILLNTNQETSFTPQQLNSLLVRTIAYSNWEAFYGIFRMLEARGADLIELIWFFAKAEQLNAMEFIISSLLITDTDSNQTDAVDSVLWQVYKRMSDDAECPQSAKDLVMEHLKRQMELKGQQL